MTTKKIALFIDADNISAKFGKQIIETLEKRGEIFIRRIYGNWEKISLHGWNDCILNFSLRAVQQPDFVSGKNATDMSLTIDAMDVLYGGKAEVFAIVSNDSDFTPLAIRLREGGMNVIGIGNSHATNSFRSACNEFIDLSEQIEIPVPVVSKKRYSPAQGKIQPVQLSLFDEEKIPSLETAQPVEVIQNPKVISIADRQLQSEHDKKIQQIHNVLKETATIHADQAGFTPLCWAGQSIHDKNLGFGVKDFGYDSLEKFVSAFPNLYEVIKRTNGENFCYRCLTVEQKKVADDTDKKIQRIHDILKKAANNHGDENGFLLLNTAGQELKSKNLGFTVRDFGYGTLQDFISAFPKLYEKIQQTNGVCYRCLSTAQKVSATDNTPAQKVSVADNTPAQKASAVDNTPAQKVPIADNTPAQKISAADNKRLQQIHNVLQETAKTYGDKDGLVNLGQAGSALTQKNLSIKGLGHSTLNKFISAFPQLYEVRQSGGAFFYRCVTAKQKKPDSNDNKLQQIHNVLRETAKTYADKKGFVNLGQAGNALTQKNLSIKSFGHSKLGKFLSTFPNLYEVKTNSYRCKQ